MCLKKTVVETEHIFHVALNHWNMLQVRTTFRINAWSKKINTCTTTQHIRFDGSDMSKLMSTNADDNDAAKISGEKNFISNVCAAVRGSFFLLSLRKALVEHPDYQILY